ncbi:MAG: putative permease [Firmicutes bacterium]|nr:putative permease [Bacillota bacterium]
MWLVKRYRLFLAVAFINLLLLLLRPSVGLDSIILSADSLQQMLVVIPPIFVLLGLLDIWVPREIMIKLMGKQSGIIGMTIAFSLGSMAAGPLYAAFPIAEVLLKKGSSFFNVIIFIGAWSTTKIPLLLFEASAMGWEFMLARFIIDIPGIVLIAYFTEKLLSSREMDLIYGNKEIGKG